MTAINVNTTIVETVIESIAFSVILQLLKMKLHNADIALAYLRHVNYDFFPVGFKMLQCNRTTDMCVCKKMWLS